MMLETVKILMAGYDAKEIERRLNDIFNGYLGCDTGDTPSELQQNHHLINCIIDVFRKIEQHNE